nr:MAG TPA: hypothetical protein [Caudoviricetes sp.]
MNTRPDRLEACRGFSLPPARWSAPAFSGAIFCTAAKHPQNRAYTACLY